MDLYAVQACLGSNAHSHYCMFRIDSATRFHKSCTSHWGDTNMSRLILRALHTGWLHDQPTEKITGVCQQRTLRLNTHAQSMPAKTPIPPDSSLLTRIRKLRGHRIYSSSSNPIAIWPFLPLPSSMLFGSIFLCVISQQGELERHARARRLIWRSQSSLWVYWSSWSNAKRVQTKWSFGLASHSETKASELLDFFDVSPGRRLQQLPSKHRRECYGVT